MSDDYNGDYDGGVRAAVYATELRLRALEHDVGSEYVDEYEDAVKAVTELRMAMRPESYFGDEQ